MHRKWHTAPIRCVCTRKLIELAGLSAYLPPYYLEVCRPVLAAMDVVKMVCPCPFGDESKTKLVEMSPFKSSTGGSDSDDNNADSTLSDRARGWLSAAAAPVKAFQERRQEDAARAERTAGLKSGTAMKLLTKEVPGGMPIKISLSGDGALVTWQSLQLVNGMPESSGVLALSSVREVAPVLQVRRAQTRQPDHQGQR